MENKKNEGCKRKGLPGLLHSKEIIEVSMLKQIHLENFKAQKDCDYSFSKFNVLTGQNSTGKTSVIQSLVFIKQSMLKKEIDFNDYLLRLGDYREVIHRHDTSLPMQIKVTLQQADTLVGYQLDTSLEGVVESFFVNDDKVWDWDSRADGAVEASGRLFFSIAANGYRAGEYRSMDNANLTKAVHLQKQTVEWFENALYLSSNRGFTKYNYPLLAGTPSMEDITKRTGDMATLEEWLSNLIVYRINEARRYPNTKKQLDLMTERLSSLGVEISPYVMGGPSVVIDLAEGDMWVSAVNSGYGVNQSVSSIVLGTLALPGTMIMLEEPEIHLHPTFQRKITQILVDIANEGKQVLITSHSDHVLQKLRQFVLDGYIQKEDVKVYNFEKIDRVTQATEIDITDEIALKNLF